MLRHWLLVAELEDLFKGRKRHDDGATWTRGDGSEWRYGADGKPERVKKGRPKEPKPAAEPKPKARRKRGAADVKLPTYPTSAWKVNPNDWMHISTELRAHGLVDEATALTEAEQESAGPRQHAVRQRSLDRLHEARATGEREPLTFRHLVQHIDHFREYQGRNLRSPGSAEHLAAAHAHWQALKNRNSPEYGDLASVAEQASRIARRADANAASRRRDEERSESLDARSKRRGVGAHWRRQ